MRDGQRMRLPAPVVVAVCAVVFGIAASSWRRTACRAGRSCRHRALAHKHALELERASKWLESREREVEHLRGLLDTYRDSINADVVECGYADFTGPVTPPHTVKINSSVVGEAAR